MLQLQIETSVFLISFLFMREIVRSNGRNRTLTICSKQLLHISEELNRLSRIHSYFYSLIRCILKASRKMYVCVLITYTHISRDCGKTGKAESKSFKSVLSSFFFDGSFPFFIISFDATFVLLYLSLLT